MSAEKNYAIYVTVYVVIMMFMLLSGYDIVTVWVWFCIGLGVILYRFWCDFVSVWVRFFIGLGIDFVYDLGKIVYSLCN